MDTLLNQDQLTSLLRSVLKMIGAALVARGAMSATIWEQLVGGIIALFGLLWSYFHHAAPAIRLNPQAGPPSPKP